MADFVETWWINCGASNCVLTNAIHVGCAEPFTESAESESAESVSAESESAESAKSDDELYDGKGLFIDVSGLLNLWFGLFDCPFFIPSLGDQWHKLTNAASSRVLLNFLKYVDETNENGKKKEQVVRPGQTPFFIQVRSLSNECELPSTNEPSLTNIKPLMARFNMSLFQGWRGTHSL